MTHEVNILFEQKYSAQFQAIQKMNIIHSDVLEVERVHITRMENFNNVSIKIPE